ncbi:MAG TPA: TatD family hydrolase [Desulfobacteraceae bacterium]|nr:TatD family hydrolase [Desulfobacteraceae bacterium]
MKLFDSHCHIDDPCFDEDFDDVLARAQNAGVDAMMIAGVTMETNKKAVGMAEKYPNVFAAVGIHPHDVKQCSGEMLQEVKQLAASSCVKAWGEIGLDFNRMFSPAPIQEQWLDEQMAAADDLGLPIIFHERDSNGRFLEMVRDFRFKNRQGVVHCFSGSKEEMFTYLDLGYYIGITGILTIKQRGAMLRELAAMIPMDRIVIETDAPYLTPAPQKNKTRRNEPAFVKSVMTTLAETRAEDVDLLAEQIWQNTCQLYNIAV